MCGEAWLILHSSPLGEGGLPAGTVGTVQEDFLQECLRNQSPSYELPAWLRFLASQP